MKKPLKKNTPPSRALPIDSGKGDWKWYLLISAVAFVSFGYSVFNYYALDDAIVLLNNTFVQKGVEGIMDILSKDTFAGMTKENIMVLAGGRYRPLSVVSFAIEYSMWGNKPGMSHLVNVLLYAVTGIFLFKLLKSILAKRVPGNFTTLSGLIAILFMALPIHSEAVINIKGRDDIMCLLFFLLASIQLLKYVRTNTSKHFYYSMAWYFLSLMSKETALTYVLIFPLTLHFFTAADKSKKTKTTIAYIAIALIFLLFRHLATKDNGGTVSTDVLNDPFVHASIVQRYATVFLTWLYYLKLIVFPLHLSYDYNYNEIPLTTFANWKVLLSLALHAFFAVVAIRGFRKKSVYTYSILFFYIVFSIMSNFFFNIGSIFAERFMLIPSIGFCIAVVFGWNEFSEKLKTESTRKFLKNAGITLLSTFVILSCVRNFYRCPDWDDNNSLFIADIDETPNSAKIHLNAGIAYITLSQGKEPKERDSLLYMAIDELKIGIDIYPTFIDGYQNTGVAYNWMGNFEKAEEWWEKARSINPNNRNIAQYDKVIAYHYFQKGIDHGLKNEFEASIYNLRKALRVDSTNADIYYNIGGAYFTFNRYDSAEYFFRKTLQVNPQYVKAAEGLKALEMARGQR